MTTGEIHDAIQNCPGMDASQMTMLIIMEKMNMKIAELEMRLCAAERSAHRAAEIAGCLANGIQPD